MLRQLTKEEAIALGDSKEWERWSLKMRASFQLRQECLCMPFPVFHEAVQESLGRPVWTHEFATGELLLKELEGSRDAPSMEEIMALIPEEKRMVIELPSDD